MLFRFQISEAPFVVTLGIFGPEANDLMEFTECGVGVFIRRRSRADLSDPTAKSLEGFHDLLPPGPRLPLWFIAFPWRIGRERSKFLYDSPGCSWRFFHGSNTGPCSIID